MQRIAASIRVLAIIGVLVHAGLIVWHSASMLGMAIQRAELATALSEICHGAGQVVSTSSELPDIPSGESDGGGCPVCKGLVSGIAILSTPFLIAHRPDVDVARMEIVGEAIARRLRPVRPPSRAPPSLA